MTTWLENASIVTESSSNSASQEFEDNDKLKVSCLFPSLFILISYVDSLPMSTEPSVLPSFATSKDTAALSLTLTVKSITCLFPSGSLFSLSLHFKLTLYCP